ncbi:type II toxin-antitoxin system PemK/MazF family toxin [Candidatus Parcubacteria bacterium]|nr:type II toxin-antitoxin system PemK/MazF family toxin [Candidatus Parcubacteria bacterium]
MLKDFDEWNKVKKNVNAYNNRRYYKAREIWWCKLGINIGFEQDGTGKEFDRPVLVIKRFNKDISIVAPLTTSNKNNKYYISIGKIGGKNAKVIISQIKLIDTKRFYKREAILDKETFNLIKKTIRNMFW